MYIFSARLNAHTIRPAYIKMADRPNIVLPDIEEPVKYVVVVFSVQLYFVATVEDRSCFLTDQATCS